ncbi:2-dehydropantoate 2-reductase [Candidatus Moduliflexus flocculans]|uniref:2-dehydropantoate 2-reductase n=1 Tax=Candidatus Moduliflexus flocculans TaxID=1499966 RepID=A0A0S6W0U6_9BACT|nr:2-dehydropantoate 2-reductase [Candidatus Moduliflexus flocculans]
MAINNICVVGVGGVGGYFGGLMVHSFASGKQISFIARGAHLAQIRERGLMLNTSSRQGLVCTPTLATDRLEDAPTPDLYLLCVKSYDLADVAAQMSRNINEKTIVLPLLNGVDIYERIREELATGIVLPACVYVGTHIAQPGVVTQKGGDGAILCGPDSRHPEFDAAPLLKLFEQAQIQCTWNRDPYPAIWEKFMFIAAFGLVCVASDNTLGEVMADAEALAQTRGIMEEILAIARVKGVNFADDVVERSLAKAGNFPPETKTSYHRDVETPGKRNEGDLFGGAILRMGEEFGVPTPVTRQMYAMIQKNRGISSCAS